VSNDGLREALAAAKMTVRDLAAAVEVDEKTAARWVSDKTRIPHRKHRWAAAEALGVDEAVLWPRAVREALKTGHDREIVAVYPFRSALPRSLWRDLITGATKTLTFAGYTSYFLWLEVPNLRGILRRKAEQGATVRFVVGDPDGEVTRERERIEAVPLTVSTRIMVTLDELDKLGSSVETRLSDRHIATSVWAFDDDMIVSVHLADLLGHDSPTLHIHRRQESGLYDRFTGHVEHLWQVARPRQPRTPRDGTDRGSDDV
jgi:transcriptional regulator with XRE-family HTH domain